MCKPRFQQVCTLVPDHELNFLTKLLYLSICWPYILVKKFVIILVFFVFNFFYFLFLVFLFMGYARRRWPQALSSSFFPFAVSSAFSSLEVSLSSSIRNVNS